MESLPLGFFVPPPGIAAMPIKGMLDRDYALTGGTTSTTDCRLESEQLPLVLEQILPLTSQQAFANRPRRSAATKRTPSGKPQSRTLQKSVLVVDDVQDVTEMIALFLKHAGYSVATADSARMALQLAGEKNFDLVISDIGMPGMNGYELAGSLRRQAEYESIPIIAVTGYSEYDDRGRALQAGFNAHMTKPIDPTQLLNLMNDLLG